MEDLAPFFHIPFYTLKKKSQLSKDERNDYSVQVLNYHWFIIRYIIIANIID